MKSDTIDFWAENAWPTERHFTSQQAYERALDADGLMLKVPKARGVSPVSPETLRWATDRYAITTTTLPETFTVRLEDD